MLEVLVDADLVAYRCAATCEGDDTSDIVLYRCNDTVEKIIDALGATAYTLYLSGGENFRKKIDPEYKAHRKDKPRPKWLEACREFLVQQWQAKVTDGIEADDALGMAQRDDTFICSLDKDLLQIPGCHYNWVKDEEYYISEEEGLYNFWMQTIVGDVADNVFGIRGLGPVKAAKILQPIFTLEGKTLEELDQLYYDTIASLYNDNDRLHRNCKLLYIHRKENDSWLSPQERNQPRKKSGRPVGSKASLPVSSEPVVDAGLPNMKP